MIQQILLILWALFSRAVQPVLCSPRWEIVQPKITLKTPVWNYRESLH